MSVLEFANKIFRLNNNGNAEFYAFFSDSNAEYLKKKIENNFDINPSTNELLETMVLVFRDFGCSKVEQLNAFTMHLFSDKAQGLRKANERYVRNIYDNENNNFLDLLENPRSNSVKNNLMFNTEFDVIDINRERSYDFYPWIDPS
jgi:hypothetical protein